MSLVRRLSLMIALVASSIAMTAAPAAAATHPFGSHTGSYFSGTLFPAVSQATADATTLNYYNTRWKARFLKSGCGAGRYYIASPDANVINVAEGQGYGMVIDVMMGGADPNAQTIFDGLYKFVQDHPSVNNPNTMAAENSPCTSVNGADSATDGDMDIAYSLLLADAQWGSAGALNYKAEAVKRINAIKQSEINPTTNLLLLGDWSQVGEAHRFGTRTSDFIIDHFRAFRVATGDTAWDTILSAHQTLITTMQATYAPNTGLLPDFIITTNTTPKPAGANFLESKADGKYSYNACRDPWRLGVDALLNNSATSRAQAEKMTSWVRTKTGSNPALIRDGYSLAGLSLAGTTAPSVEFMAPFGVAAMSSSNQAWVNSLWTTLNGTSESSTQYFATALKLQTLIIMSRNAWTVQ